MVVIGASPTLAGLHYRTHVYVCMYVCMYVCLHMCGCIPKILIEQTDTKDFKFAHVLKQIHVDMMMYAVASSPGHSQILSCSSGENPIFLHGCDKMWEWPGDEVMYAGDAKSTHAYLKYVSCGPKCQYCLLWYVLQLITVPNCHTQRFTSLF